MPFALIVIGLVLLVTGVNNTQAQLFTLVKGEFTGSNNFLYLAASIGIVGAVGYIDKMRSISNVFLGLVIVAIIFSHAGFFSSLVSQLSQTKTATISTATTLPTLTPLTPLTPLSSLGFGGGGGSAF
jgi:pheromone shutdown protein TraB